MVTILNTSRDLLYKVGFSKRFSAEIAKWSCLIHIILPLLICVYIYTFCRPSGIGVQELWTFILGETTFSQYHSIYQSTLAFSDWMIYSLPAALWTFSITLLGMLLDIDPKRRPWLVGLIPLSLTWGLELLQYFQFTDGTFDPMDIIAGWMGYAAALLYSKTHHGVIIDFLKLPMRRVVFSVLFVCVYLGDIWL